MSDKKRKENTTNNALAGYDVSKAEANDLEREGKWAEAARVWATIAETMKNPMVIKMARQRAEAARLNARENGQPVDDAQPTRHTVAGRDGEPVVPGHESDVEPATDGASSEPGAGDAQSETAAPKPLDARLPGVGTIIRKLDRKGNIRCECKVVEGGIDYKGQVYQSLSGAGLAAAKDLGLKSTTNDGWTFWGVRKRPSTRGTEGAKAGAVASLERAFAKYHQRANEIAKRAIGDDRVKVLATLRNQGAALAALVPPAAVPEA
jgi:hypothetical protein